MESLQRFAIRVHAHGRPGVLLLAAACAFSGCTPAPRESAAPPAVVAPAAPAPAAPASAAVYVVDAPRSEVRILTFRAGPLARLGHSHVLISRDVTGRVTLPEQDAPSTFELEVPVATLAVDEPAARSEEGDEFASVPSATDVEGTRRNLLGPQVLDAAAFPVVRVTGSAANGGPADYVVAARLEVRGRATPLEIPVRVQRTGSELVARGEFRVAQSALGLTPFSVALGALQVRDELVVRFRIVAVSASSPPSAP